MIEREQRQLQLRLDRFARPGDGLRSCHNFLQRCFDVRDPPAVRVGGAWLQQNAYPSNTRKESTGSWCWTWPLQAPRSARAAPRRPHYGDQWANPSGARTPRLHCLGRSSHLAVAHASFTENWTQFLWRCLCLATWPGAEKPGMPRPQFPTRQGYFARLTPECPGSVSALRW